MVEAETAAWKAIGVSRGKQVAARDGARGCPVQQETCRMGGPGLLRTKVLALRVCNAKFTTS